MSILSRPGGAIMVWDSVFVNKSMYGAILVMKIGISCGLRLVLSRELTRQGERNDNAADDPSLPKVMPRRLAQIHSLVHY